jgi:RNA polymerase sigma factor (sigma-70 family)
MLVSLEEDLERITLGKAGAAHDARALEEEKQSRVDFLQRHIRSMSQRCREVLELRDLRGESYIDVARALKIPPGTVMSQLARCRKALRHLVESELKGTKN